MALAGKQAEVLNILLEDLLEGHAVSETKLKEVLGHTPIQVHILYHTCCRHAVNRVGEAGALHEMSGCDHICGGNLHCSDAQQLGNSLAHPRLWFTL